MNLQDFSNILKEEIIHIINSNDHEEYIINSFFWVAQQYSSNDIFFAIKGLNTDGNIFIPTAIENGYKYVLSDNEEAIKVNSIQYSNIIFFFVKNVQNTLNILAEWGVGKFKGIKICITGSAGKTTTSYLLKNLLNDFSSVISTSKYNSQYYLRRMCFELYNKKEEYFVAELSSDSKGMIDLFSSIIQPHYSIITSIGNAHLENFATRENILLEKSSIINNTQVASYMPIDLAFKIQSTIYGISNKEKIFYVENNYKIESESITYKYQNKDILTVKYQKLQGEHNYSNINLILHLLGHMQLLNEGNLKKIQKTLENITCFPGRGNIITIKNKNFNFKITCEHHNSNPISFEKAISNIKEDTLVIMGFMYSLGEETFQQHEHIFRLLESNFHIKAIFLGDDKLYTLPFINKYKNIISRETHFLSCLELVKTQSIKNIFIKGSRGSALEKFIKEILNNI